MKTMIAKVNHTELIVQPVYEGLFQVKANGFVSTKGKSAGRVASATLCRSDVKELYDAMTAGKNELCRLSIFFGAYEASSEPVTAKPL